MIERVTGGKALPDDVLDQIVAKTDGVPLFVEELTKTVLESDLLKDTGDHYVLSGPLPSLAIPASLQDSLMARLDRLASIKEVAQLAATVGRTFSHELLVAISPLNDKELQDALTQLVQAELIYRRGLSPDVTYEFKHALVQEAAYQSLLKGTRQHYHQRIARVLEEQFPQTAESEPELLAHHHTEALLPKQAIGYWQRAGQRASERSANLEAIAHLTRALDLLKTLPDSLERAQRELDLQTALGPALMAAKGFAAPEVEQTYKRARDLCEQVGDDFRLFRALWGLGKYYQLSVQLEAARELGGQLLVLAERLQEEPFLIEAHLAMGVALFYAGNISAAQSHYDEVLARYDPKRHSTLAFEYGEDPGVVCQARAAVTLWTLGYADRALDSGREAVALARQLEHPFSLARALNFTAWVHTYRREPRQTQELAEALIHLADQRGFPFWLKWGRFLRAWALTDQGQAEGIAEMVHNISTWSGTGAVAYEHWQCLLAEAYAKIGQSQNALDALSRAAEFRNRTGVRWWEAEGHRLRGEFLLKKGGALIDAEACFLQALQVAREQQAKSLELRAATSLARLWRDQGKRTEARGLIAPIYGWFTEGFDTADLKEAKALTEELS